MKPSISAQAFGMNLFQQKSDELKFILIKLDDTWYAPRYDDIRMHSGKEENETGGRNVMIWSMFCQETLSFIIRVLSAYLVPQHPRR